MADELVIVGHGAATNLFIERLKLSWRRATRLPLESYASLVALYEGRADVAVIDEALAAQASGITFVPLQHEWVDVVVSKARGREFARLLQAIVADEAFHREYTRVVIGDTSQLGSIVYEC